jgi:hypothetical protein
VTPDPDRAAIIAASAVREALSEVRTELPRADAKAAGLANIAGLALPVELVLLTRAHLSTVAVLAGVVTVAATAAAVALLLLAIRPRLDGDHGLVRWSRAALNIPPDHQDQGATLVWYSQAAYRKYRRIRTAVDLLLLAIAAALATGLTVAIH